MDNYISQQMQNWKKMMIMDPLLNNLFDHNLNIKDFIHQKILTQQHQQIVKTYSHLSSVKHAISKHIQKIVETKHQQIEASFLSKHKITNQLKLNNEPLIKENLKNIHNFNENYQNVKDNLTKLQNINQIIKFSKALQKFKINCRLLKTFMKDHVTFKQTVTTEQNSLFKQNRQRKGSKGNALKSQQREESFGKQLNTKNQSLNLPKISRLLKQLNQLITKNDFSGIKYYESEKQFINNSRAILYSLSEKQLNNQIQKYQDFITENIQNKGKQNDNQQQKIKNFQQNIQQKLKILHSINKIKDYLTIFCKKIFQITSNVLKTLFQANSIEDFDLYFSSTIIPSVLSNSKTLIRVQQLLSNSNLSKNLTIAGIPNLFQKYMQKLVSYFNQLIKWNQEQSNKQSQKQRIQYLKNHPNQDPSIFQIKQFAQNKNPKTKFPLLYKYPTLLQCLSILVNKIHEQVLLKGEFNIQEYKFYQKKYELIKTLEPISIKFNLTLNLIIQIPVKMLENIEQKGIQQQFSKRISLISWVIKKVFKVGQKQTSELEILIQNLAQKILKNAESIIIQNNPENTRNQRKITIFTLQYVKKLLKLIEGKAFQKSYSNLQVLINHLKRIKVLKHQIQEAFQNKKYC